MGGEGGNGTSATQAPVPDGRAAELATALARLSRPSPPLARLWRPSPPLSETSENLSACPGRRISTATQDLKIC